MLQNFLFSSLSRFKRFLNSDIVLGNSGNFPFSINFWSRKICEICMYFYSNKQNNTPHKCLRRFMITFPNLPCSSFLSRGKLQNCVATSSYKPKSYWFTKMFHLNAKQFHVLDFIFDVGQCRVLPTAHWKEVKKWCKAITTTSVTTVTIDSSSNPFRKASYA